MQVHVMRARSAAFILLAVLAGTAHAGVAVDWAKGVVTAEGIGVADRHAPNPTVARGTSRRGAEDAARAQIAAKLGELPVASGGTVAVKAKDPAVKARLEHAVAAAIAIAAQPETDGAWKVTMAVPIEAVREALDGPRVLPAAGDAGPAVVVVEGVTAKPAVGWTIGGKHVAALWVTDVPAWAKDAPRIKSDGTAGTESTLFVIVMHP